MTELDKQIQEIALHDWPKFVKMIGQDRVIAAKVCLLRQGGNSYGQIINRINEKDVTIQVIRTACKSCG